MTEKSIVISEEIYGKLQKRVDEKKNFSSVEDYVQDILKQVVKKIEEETKINPYSEEDEAKVKERLKSLGYLD